MNEPPAFHGRPPSGMENLPVKWADASGWFVIFTLATLLFLLGCFAIWALIIWRRGTKPAPHLQLLMDLETEAEGEKQTAATPAEEVEPRAAWEQPADWWKKVGE